MAERMGFEPMKELPPLHAFQACAFNHSATSPVKLKIEINFYYIIKSMAKNKTNFKIYDCITFYQANMLFQLRFEILKDVVDYFVICEANKTHTGLKKNFNFNPKIPDKYKEKIIYIKVKDLPDINIKGKKDYKLLRLQMENLFKGIKFAKPDDYIIFSDPDEIPNPKT